MSPLVRVPVDWLSRNRQAVSIYAVNLAMHAAFLLILAVIMLPMDSPEAIMGTLGTDAEDNPEVFEFADIPQKLIVEEESSAATVETEIVTENVAEAQIDVNDLAPSVTLQPNSFAGVPLNLKSDFGGRSRVARSQLVASQGGNAASEQAVAWGLRWLARHQQSDGGWSFNHVQDKKCRQSCTRPGSLAQRRMGATAMALLAFLGAGHTHQEGNYQRQVKKGLDYLLQNMKTDGNGGDLRGKGGQMYTQGLAAIALCEAYALSKDYYLKRSAQRAINFIVYAQDPSGGGWRYQPRQPGDTSVVGWQVMALTSAKMAKLKASASSMALAGRFLNSVQTEYGATYGYQGPGNAPATTAIGLLCRMYLGWDKDNEGLKRGVEFLSRTGPLPQNMYYNYYATQVLHHWGGEEWRKWNLRMRDGLVDSQIRKGHAHGSWTPQDMFAAQGGRLYVTCLSIMTLEVYYRHLPLYQRESLAKRR